MEYSHKWLHVVHPGPKLRTAVPHRPDVQSYAAAFFLQRSTLCGACFTRCYTITYICILFTRPHAEKELTYMGNTDTCGCTMAFIRLHACNTVTHMVVLLRCRLPYGQNRISNLLVRLNTRLRLPFMAIFVLCFILLWAVKIDSCFSFVTSWNGILPMQVTWHSSEPLLPPRGP